MSLKIIWLNFNLSGFEETAIPGQIEDSAEKVKKEVQFKTRGDLAMDDLGNSDRLQNGSTSSITSIPSKPAKGAMCCCRPKAKKASREKRSSSNDEEQIVVGQTDENNQREELEIQNSLSDRSTVEFHEVSVTDR